MGLLKQLMIFGKSGLQGLPTRVALFLWAFSRQGATGVPLLLQPYHDSQHGILWQARGEPQYLETFRAGADPGTILSALVAQLVDHLGRRWILEAGLRVGGPGTPPFWRTRNGFCTVWSSAR